jgi:hypothetical protein
MRVLAIGAHPDDIEINCKIQNAFRGLQNGVEYAEGFRACRLHGYMPDSSALPLRQ